MMGKAVALQSLGRFALSGFNKSVIPFTQRCFSTERISVEKSSNDGIALLKFHNRPVNTMGYKFLEDSIEAIQKLEKENCKALIITSTIPKVFCAGVDFNEVLKPNQERLVKYWKLFEDFVVSLYSAKFATIAAINGVAPAGGCVLSLATDYRIILQTGTIGLNEVAISLPLHSWIVQMCANVTGMRNAELAGLTGELYKADKALRIGMVDEIATDENDLMAKALAQAKVYANLPDKESWYITKMEGRKSIANLIRERELHSGVFLDSINSEATQRILSTYANKLKKK